MAVKNQESERCEWIVYTREASWHKRKTRRRLRHEKEEGAKKEEKI